MSEEGSPHHSGINSGHKTDAFTIKLNSTALPERPSTKWSEGIGRNNILHKQSQKKVKCLFTRRPMHHNNT